MIRQGATLDMDAVLDAIAEAGGGVLSLPGKYIAFLNAAYGTKWKPSDMHHPMKARTLGRLYLSHFTRPSTIGRMPTSEDAVRIWHGGPTGHLRDFTLSYWLRVRPLLNELSSNPDS